MDTCPLLSLFGFKIIIPHTIWGIKILVFLAMTQLWLITDLSTMFCMSFHMFIFRGTHGFDLFLHLQMGVTLVLFFVLMLSSVMCHTFHLSAIDDAKIYYDDPML